MKKNKLLFKLVLICFFALSFSNSFAQKFEVKGQVKSKNGESLPGVNIVIKGTTVGTISDMNGQYIINLDEAESTLVYSFIGFQKQEIKVNSQNTINVIMTEDMTDLDEVVVIGYGTVKKSDLTGSVTSIKAESLEETPAASVDALLQGKVAGVQITQTSGEPGSGVQVRIRGMSSRQGSNSPLYVIDGFPYGDAGNLKQLNPNDIESIEVLKDASASAIYGSRGANGVIIITTKGAKNNEKAKISFSSQMGIQVVDESKFDLITDPLTYAVIDNEIRENDTRGGVNPRYIGSKDESGFYFPSLTEIADGSWPHKTNWADAIMRNAVTQNYNLAISGGSEKTAYTVSANYFDQEGIVIGNDYENYTFRVKLDQIVKKNLKVGTNIAMSYVNRDKTQSNSGIGRNPIFPIYDEDGGYYKIGATDFYNPVMLANEITDISDEYDINALVFIDWEIIDGLHWKTQGGAKLGHSVGDYYEPRTTWTGDLFNGVGKVTNYTGWTALVESYLTYVKTYNEKHQITAMGGVTNEVSQARGSELRGEGFVNDNLKNELLTSASERKLSNFLSKQTLQSFIARLNYAFNNRYLITLTGRADGSSKFGTNNKWAFFPSGAAAWKMHQETFMQDQELISTLKIRSSYGFTGNQAIPIYGTLNQYGMRKYVNGSSLISGYGPYVIGNSGLKWETTSQFDVGFDLGFLGNRIMVNADYYVKRSTDLLRQKQLPFSSGFDNVWVNDGEILNKGFELSVDAAVLENDFKWNIVANIAHNENEVVDIGEEGEGEGVRTGGYLETFRDYPTRWRNGQPMNVIVGYRVDGIIQTNEEGLAAGLSGEEAMPGEYKYVDISGNGVIDDEDQEVLGNVQPDFIFGINNEFRYKNFDLSIQLNGVIGSDLINLKKFEGSNSLGRWTADNKNNDYPSLRGGRLNKMSDWWIEDGSYLRIANVTLGYNLPNETIPFIQKARVYFSGSNLHTFTNYTGFDPEFSDGVDYGSYPKYATYTFGLNVTF